MGTTSSPGAGSLPDAAMPTSASSSEVQLDSSRLSAAFGAALGAVDDDESGAAGTASAIGVGGEGRGVVVDVETAPADIPGVNAGTPGSPSISPDLSAPAAGGVGGSVGVDAAGVDVGTDAGAADVVIVLPNVVSHETGRVGGCPLVCRRCGYLLGLLFSSVGYSVDFLLFLCILSNVFCPQYTSSCFFLFYRDWTKYSRFLGHGEIARVDYVVFCLSVSYGLW